MTQIAAYAEIKGNCIRREVKGVYARRTDFFSPPPDVDQQPHAFLAERAYQAGIRPHFHGVDQFQVVVSGSGTLGRHELDIHMVHFARAYTPYGPITPTPEGLGFLTLRLARTKQFVLPEAREKLKAIPNRDPWQVTELPKFGGSESVAIHEFSKIKDATGLAAYSLSLKGDSKMLAPDPVTSGGQYLIVTKGSLIHQGKEYPAITLVFVKPEEEPFPLAAGTEGLEALVLNFPRSPR